MNILPSRVADTGYTQMLERFAEECPRNQFIREFTKNSIQAIERYKIKSGNKDFKGEIQVDVNWKDHELTEPNSLVKICFIDNGIGMSHDEMQNYCKDLASSSDISLEEKNYGFGAKISSAIHNKLGIKYDSWQNGVGHSVIFIFDPITKEYGLQQFEEDGNYKYYFRLDNETKPNLIKEHGTCVTLYGNSEEDDTYSKNYYGVSGSIDSWVVAYLNKRFLKVPEGIQIQARIGHYRGIEDKKHCYLSKIKGLAKCLDEHTIKEGITDLSDVRIKWRILDKNRSQNSREYNMGHTAVIFEDEVFDLSYGNGNKALFFGIYIGARNIVLHVIPKTTDYFQNTTRVNLIKKDNDEDGLPWEQWQNEFLKNTPKEIEKYLEDENASVDSGVAEDRIKDRLKELIKYFSVTKYKKSIKGKHLVDPNSLVEGFVDGDYLDGPGKIKSTRRRGGVMPGKLQALISIQTEESGKVQAVKARPDPFPKVKWINPEEQKDLIEQSEIIDRAAVFRVEQNIVFANKTYSGFTDTQKHFSEKFPALPEEIIVDTVREIFEQQLMESVAGAITLKDRQYWSPDDYKKAVSPESLTVAVAARYYFFQTITRRLKQINKSGFDVDKKAV